MSGDVSHLRTFTERGLVRVTQYAYILLRQNAQGLFEWGVGGGWWECYVQAVGHNYAVM